MKIEVGQWVRTDTSLFKSKSIKTSGFINNQNENGWGAWPEDIIKVANTPQELIQVGDLYTDNHNRKYECLLVQNGVLYSHYFGLAKPCGTLLTNVTSILTPNSNGGYDLQWSDEK